MDDFPQGLEGFLNRFTGVFRWVSLLNGLEVGLLDCSSAIEHHPLPQTKPRRKPRTLARVDQPLHDIIILGRFLLGSYFDGFRTHREVLLEDFFHSETRECIALVVRLIIVAVDITICIGRRGQGCERTVNTSVIKQRRDKPIALDI
jgi:hypothetical protein